MTASNARRAIAIYESLLAAVARRLRSTSRCSAQPRASSIVVCLMVTETGQLASKPSASKCGLTQSVAEGCDGPRRAA